MWTLSKYQEKIKRKIERKNKFKKLIEAPKGEIINCPFCGKELSSDMIFCLQCGKKLKK